jgi:hypothetical protein
VGGEKNQMPDGKDRLLRAAQLLDLAEHLTCTLGTCDRAIVVQFAVTELQVLGEAVALMTAAVDNMKPAVWGGRRN